MMTTYRFRGIGNSLDAETLSFGLYGLGLDWRGKLPEFSMVFDGSLRCRTHPGA